MNQEWDRLNRRYERLLEIDNLSTSEKRELNRLHRLMRALVNKIEG